MNPWDVPDWAAEVDAWIDERLGQTGRSRSGPAEVLQQWGLSAVQRVPLVGGDAVVFKATCAHFSAEPVLTAFIAEHAGDLVPRVLAIDAQRSWMLMAAFDGPPEDPALAAPAGVALAEMQVALAGRTEELIAVGFPDRRLPATAEALGRVATDGVEIDQLTPEERDRVQAMRPWLDGVLAELDGLGLPDTLGHGDLHLGNVASHRGRPVIFDWTDASLTCPVLDLVMLGHPLDDAARRTMLDQVTAVWRQAYPAADVDRALELAPLANEAFQAVTYDAIMRAVSTQDPALRGVQARILRRLGQTWVDRGQPAG